LSEVGQAVGLAALLQALRLVQDLAQDGRCAEPAMQVLIDSVFRIDADSPLDVYGGPENIAPGIELLEKVLGNRYGNPLLTRMAINVLALERSLARDGKRLASLREGIDAARRTRDAMGSSSDNVCERLAQFYVDNLSVLKPRIMVQGNGSYLSQTRIVGRIRALLLAAVRAAVLWRQMGGTRLGLVFGRRRLLEGCRSLSEQIPAPGSSS
jgi:high frequency lysogenization protein